MIQEIRDCIANHPNVVVKFHKPACPYCVYVKPLYEAVQNTYSDTITFLDIDASKEPQAFKDAFGFSSFPTFIYFRDGKAVKSHGSNNMNLTQQEIEETIQKIYF